jgi:hypothetical protein
MPLWIYKVVRRYWPPVAAVAVVLAALDWLVKSVLF